MNSAELRLASLDKLTMVRVFLDEVLIGALMPTPDLLERMASLFRRAAANEREALQLETRARRAA